MSSFSWNNNFKLHVHKSNPNAVLPRKGYPNSAGYDLFLPTNSSDLTIPAANAGIIHRKAFNLDIRTSFASGFVALVRDRGSTGSKGIITLAGVVDADYRGDWIIWLANLGEYAVQLDVEKAVAQVLFIPVESPEVIEVNSLDSSKRGEGRLGSSDQLHAMKIPGGMSTSSGQPMLSFQNSAICSGKITEEEGLIIITGHDFSGKEYSAEWRKALCDRANAK